MADFLVDSLDDTSGTYLTAHTVSGAGATGGAWNLIAISGGGTLGELSCNAAGTGYYSTEGGTGSGCYNAATPSSADYEVEASIWHYAADSSKAGVAARCSTTDASRYEFVYDNADTTWKLRRRGADNSIAATIDTDSTVAFPDDTTYPVKITVEGSTIKGVVNGAEVCSGTDSTITAAGKAGLVNGFGSGVVQLMSVRAGPIVAAPPAFVGPDISVPALTQGTAMTPIDVSARFTGTALTFAAVGTWPGGISVSSAGVISGTPSAEGSFTGLLVRATDSSAQTADSNTFSITVNIPAGTPAITTPPLKNNTGTPLASTSGITAWVHDPVTGALVVKRTGLATNSSAVLTFADVALTDATDYRVVIAVDATGAEGMETLTAAA